MWSISIKLTLLILMILVFNTTSLWGPLMKSHALFATSPKVEVIGANSSSQLSFPMNSSRPFRLPSKIRSNIKNLLEKAAGSTNSFLNRHIFKIHVDKANCIQNMDDITLALAYVAEDEDLWTLLGEDKGIKVWKSNKPLCDNSDDSKWICIKSKTIIDAEAHKLRQLLLNSSQNQALNKYSLSREDIEIINPQCKIVWSKTKLPYTIKPFDFVTMIQDVCEPHSGTIMILSKAYDHPMAPISKSFARSYTIFGLNVLSPSSTNPNSTHLVTISHVKYAGIHPAIARTGAYQGTVNYLEHLREVAPKLCKEL